MKLSELKSSREVLDAQLKNPEFRDRWERTAIARAVALRLISYRAEHGLSQTALAEKLGMKQPAIARLEAGEKNPTWDTVARISESLRIEFVIDIAPSGTRALVRPNHVGKAQIVERVTAGSHSILVAVR